MNHEQASEFASRLRYEASTIAAFLKIDPEEVKVDLTFRLDPGPQYVVLDITKVEPLEAKVVEPVPPMQDRLQALADEAEFKGQRLQLIPEMKLVGNAYVGMAERIRQAVEPKPLTLSGEYPGGPR